MNLYDKFKDHLITLIIGIVSFGTVVPLFLNYLKTQFGAGIPNGVMVFMANYFFLPFVVLVLIVNCHLFPRHTSSATPYFIAQVKADADPQTFPGREIDYINMFIKNKAVYYVLANLALAIVFWACIYLVHVPDNTKDAVSRLNALMILMGFILALQILYFFANRRITWNANVGYVITLVLVLELLVLSVNWLFVSRHKQTNFKRQALSNLSVTEGNQDMIGYYYRSFKKEADAFKLDYSTYWNRRGGFCANLTLRHRFSYA